MLGCQTKLRGRYTGDIGGTGEPIKEYAGTLVQELYRRDYKEARWESFRSLQ